MTGEFSKNDVAKIARSIFRSQIEGRIPSKNPKAYILGGQPGAGKTSMQDMFRLQNADQIIVINGDEYRKRMPGHSEIKKLPGDEYARITQKFANSITESLIDKASSMSYNLIIEGTLRNQDTALHTCRLLKERGYLCELSVLAVNREVSYYSTKQREIMLRREGEVGRRTVTDNHNEVVRNLPRNVSRIYKSREFDNIKIYDRKGNCLYDMEKTPEADPGYIVQNKLYGKTLEDVQEIHHIRQSIRQMKNIQIHLPEL